jgi:Spy/CpxP family protein refolding chaperone
MSNKVHQLIVGVGLLGLAAGAWAQGGPDSGPHGDGNGDWGHGEYHHRHHHHHHHHHHHGWGHGGMEGGPGFMLARGLNLTDAQKQQIHTILGTARQNAMKEMQDHKPGGAPDRLALMNPGDPNYAAAVQAAKKRAADRIQHMSDLHQQIYNVLTAEQKSEVQKRVAAWKTRMAQRDDGAKGPPGPANR